MDPNDIVIVAARRTPSGALLGQLGSLTAPQLSAIAHEAVLADTKLDPASIDEVILGCVLQAGIGQAPARQSAMLADIPTHVGATTINKMCGSGMKAVMMAHDTVKAGNAKLILAGGMESMSNAPYLLQRARSGYRLGHGALKDHMFLDGLEDAYEPGKLMGVFADQTAKHYNFTREQQDEFAARSMQCALDAQANGDFDAEIAPVTVKTRREEHVIEKDEGPDPAKLEKITRLKPAFTPDGTVTPANSSSIADGAASLLITTYSHAKAMNLKPLAKITAQASFAQAPQWFTTAPVEAIKSVLDKASWQINKVDLFEINEAFAVVTMAAVHKLSLDLYKVNVNGGACALGHPIGASGARILVTLLHALKKRKLKRGVASLCIGGGEATAMAVEII